MGAAGRWCRNTGWGIAVRIAAYIRPQGLINPTGVGKHQINMVEQLSRLPGVEVTLLVHQADLCEGRLPGETSLNALPRTVLPGSGRFWQLFWCVSDWPSVDRWLPADIDWIYCPFDAWIPTKRAKFAATIHCDNWFEKDLPWYHDADIRRKRWRLAPLFRRILRRADLVLTVSEFLRGRLTEVFSVPRERVAVVGNGVEEIFFEVGGEQRASVGESSQHGLQTVWVVAPLVPRKGAAAIVAAAKCLATVAPEIRILVAGGAKGHEPGSADAQGCSNLQLLGYVDGDELAVRMKGALALLILSRYETFGIPAIEAMAACVPVVAARHAALPEVVGDAAILVNPDNAKEVAEALVSLAEDKHLRAGYIERGWLRSNEFTWGNCAKKALAAMQGCSTRGS